MSRNVTVWKNDAAGTDPTAKSITAERLNGLEADISTAWRLSNETRSVMLGGGGSISWNLSSNNKLAWTSPFTIQPVPDRVSPDNKITLAMPTSGVLNAAGVEQASGSGITLATGDGLWMTHVRGAQETSNITWRVITFSDALQENYFDDEGAFLIASCFASGNVHLRNGLVLAPGDTLTGSAPSQNFMKLGSIPDPLADDWKQSARVASTANITLSGTQTIDTIAVVAGDRVLVKNQTTAANNGIYVVASGAWTRATDADTSAKVTPGMQVYIEDGGQNGQVWHLSTVGAITLGTTALTFSPPAAASGSGDRLAPLTNTEVSITAATTLTSASFAKTHVLTGPGYPVDLPAAAGNAGKFISFRVAPTVAYAIGTGPWFILDPNLSELIDNASFLALASGDSVELKCDGTGYNIVSQRIASRQLLDYNITANVWSSTALTQNTFTNIHTDQTFTKQNTGSRIRIAIYAGIYEADTSPTYAGSIIVDSSGVYKLSSGWGQQSLSAWAPVDITGLAAGSHTVRGRIWVTGTNSFTLRPSTSPNTDFYNLQVWELNN